MGPLDRVLDQTQRFPKYVDPATHAALDHLTTAAFMLMAGYFWGRHRRAAVAALINGLMVMGMSALTDYPGGLKKLSFRTHGKGDVVQALAAAGLPSILGFGTQSAALPFRVLALNEALVIGITDFDNELARAQEYIEAA